jgi:hypothetical protein
MKGTISQAKLTNCGKNAISPTNVQFGTPSCGLFEVLILYLLIHLSIVRPSCDDLQLIDCVRNVIHGMHMGLLSPRGTHDPEEAQNPITSLATECQSLSPRLGDDNDQHRSAH